MAEYWELEITLPNSENQRVINEFLLSLKNANKTKSTVYTYRSFLGSFFQYRKDRFSSITTDDIQRWFQIKKNLSERSIQSYKSNLRSFYSFCLEQGYIEQSPINQKSQKMCWELRGYLPNEENQNVIQAYLLSMENSSKKKRTIDRARGLLQFFFRGWEKPFSSITTEDIQGWFKEYPEWKKRNREKYECALRAFYSFCYQEGYMENSLLKRRRWVQVAKKYWELQKPLACKSNEKVINEFLLELKNNNRSKKMIGEIRIVLQLFFIERKEHFSSITPDDVWKWVNELKRNRKDTTVQGYLGYLRSFYRYCVKQGYMEELPTPYQWELRDRQENYWELNSPLLNEENRDVINEFLMNMKITNLSKVTIVGYRLFLQRFFQEKQEPFYSLHPDDIRKWFLEHQKMWKESTFARYLSVLCAFYGYCVEEGLMEKSPIKSRWFPHLPKPVPKYLEKQEIAKVRYQSEKEILRNQTFVEFFLVSGCRIGEVHRLNRTDVDLENRSARVLGKGKKIRTVHFTEKCALLLAQYLESRSDENPALFVSKIGTRLSSGRMHAIIKQIGKQAELSGSLHAHRFRHTFATELFAKGADLSFIADELGHENLSTTQIYARLPDRELISMYRKYMG